MRWITPSAVGVVPHPDLGRVAMDVAEEALLAAVRHTHRAAGAQRQQAGVDLQADVLASTECPADSAERQSHLLAGEVEACGDLAAVLVQPLRGDEQVDAGAAGIGHRQRGLQTEERLVLHADLVRALDDDLADQRLVAA